MVNVSYINVSLAWNLHAYHTAIIGWA